MPLHVHYPTLGEGELATRLVEGLSPDVELSSGSDVGTERVEVLVGGLPSRAELDACPRLRALIIPWSGLPAQTRELMRDHPDVAVHNLHHNAAPVAEHAMALLLAAARGIVRADEHLRRGDWTPRYEAPRAPLLSGRVALILGAGAVGQRLACACGGLGLRPVLVGRSARDGIRGVDELDALLPTAEVLLVALPATPETEGLLTRERLAALPTGALLVNVGRAGIVDERALYEALRDGQLAGAGLDVWYHYPTSEEERLATAPSTLPFHELERVVMSPHRAGHGLETARLRAEALAELLNAAARGEAMPNRVDVARGY